MKHELVERIAPKKFRRKVGVSQRTFWTIVTQVTAWLTERRTTCPMTCRGKKARSLSAADHMLLTLISVRHYPTFDELGVRFGISESYANKLYHRYPDILVQGLRLPGKKALLDGSLEALLLDVTEQPLERPVKHQRRYYSGKKKRHTITAQLIVCLKTLQILLVTCGAGRIHDVTLLKQGKLHILKELKKYADSGYQGLAHLYADSWTPRKASKHHPLTPEDKQYNRELAQRRITIEHVNRRCKIFRIVKETYRGKHRHYRKVWTVVAALVNLRYAAGPHRYRN